jgi:hypothetical protein
MQARWWSACCTVAALAIGCGDRSKKSSVADSSQPIVAAMATGSKTDCLTDGLWKECSLFYRLERSGFAVHAESLRAVTNGPLSIPGKQLPIGRGKIEIYVYADTGSRVRDQRRLDPKQFIPPSMPPSILKQRTMIGNENLIVLMDVAAESYRDRLADAIMAGPPQPVRSH